MKKNNLLKKFFKESTKSLIIYGIGIFIFLFGCILELVNTKQLDNREVAIAEIVDVEERSISSSSGVKDVTYYKIEYQPFGGYPEPLYYYREKGVLENLEIGTQFMIYYSLDDVYDIKEYSNNSTIYILIIMLGVSIIFINIILMINQKKKEDNKKLEKNIKNLNNINFKLNEDLVKEVNEDIRLKEAQMIDDDLEQINKENSNKSLLEQRMQEANKGNNIYNEFRNPLETNKPLNTGSIIENTNIPEYRNNHYNYQRNQDNYYGQNYQQQYNQQQSNTPYIPSNPFEKK